MPTLLPYAAYGRPPLGSGPPPYQWTANDYAALRAAAVAINCRPEDLLLVLYLESGLNPRIAFLQQDAKTGVVYPSANGLNQITKAAIGHMGMTEDQRLSLLDMTVEEQLPYVVRYYLTNNNRQGKPFAAMPDAVTLYQVNIAPATVPLVGPPKEVLYVQKEFPCKPVHQTKDAYCANRGLDLDGDGQITRTDLAKKLQQLAGESRYKKALAELKGDAPIIVVPPPPPAPPPPSMVAAQETGPDYRWLGMAAAAFGGHMFWRWRNK